MTGERSFSDSPCLYVRSTDTVNIDSAVVGNFSEEGLSIGLYDTRFGRSNVGIAAVRKF
jgi:hypothetical protein